MKCRTGFTALALLVGGAAHCYAQGTEPTVTLTAATRGDSTFSVSQATAGAHWDIEVWINNPAGTGDIDCIVQGDTTTQIDDISINFRSLDRDVNLYVYGASPLIQVSDVRTIYPVNFANADLTLMKLEVSGDVEGIRVHHLESAKIDGTMGSSTAPVSGVIMMAPTTGNAEITSLIVGGDLLGHIKGLTANDDVENIELLQVSGNIGESAYPVLIEALKIDNIIADHIYADITLDTTSTNGKVRRIVTGTDFDFVGSLTMSAFHSTGGTGVPGLFVGRNLDADITITGDLNATGEINVSDDFATNKTIQIDGDLIGDISFVYDMNGTINIDGNLTGDITMGASGLDGQIICNSADGTDAWSGDVIVGTTTLSPTASYTQTGLGGGAVGEVQFDLHYEDCEPAATSTTNGVLGSSTVSATFKVTLTHYGPVTWTSTMPVTVTFCAQSTECDNDTDVTSDFKVTNAKEGRTIVIEPDGTTPAAGVYHLSPKADVKCFGITATTPPSVASYTYDLDFNIN